MSLHNPNLPPKRFTIEDALRANNITSQSAESRNNFNPFPAQTSVVHSHGNNPHNSSSLYSVLNGSRGSVDYSSFDFGKVEITNTPSNVVPAQRNPMVITSQNLRPPEIKVTNVNNSTDANKSLTLNPKNHYQFSLFLYSGILESIPFSQLL